MDHSRLGRIPCETVSVTKRHVSRWRVGSAFCCTECGWTAVRSNIGPVSLSPTDQYDGGTHVDVTGFVHLDGGRRCRAIHVLATYDGTADFTLRASILACCHDGLSTERRRKKNLDPGTTKPIQKLLASIKERTSSPRAGSPRASCRNSGTGWSIWPWPRG